METFTVNYHPNQHPNQRSSYTRMAVGSEITARSGQQAPRQRPLLARPPSGQRPAQLVQGAKPAASTPNTSPGTLASASTVLQREFQPPTRTDKQ
jgi:hypothetical protein